MDSLSVELAAADAAFPGAVDAAQLFQNSAKAGGIDLSVNRVANDGYWSEVWMKHPFSAVYWGGRPVEDSMLTLAYASGASWNDTFWDNDRFNKLLVEARAELDEAKRREMYLRDAGDPERRWRHHPSDVRQLRLCIDQEGRHHRQFRLQLGHGWRALDGALVDGLIGHSISSLAGWPEPAIGQPTKCRRGSVPAAFFDAQRVSDSSGIAVVWTTRSVTFRSVRA
jgi:hypothetical protein